MKNCIYTLIVLFLLISPGVKSQVDPDTTERASIDRFSMEAGHLFIRDAENGFPDLMKQSTLMWNLLLPKG